MEIYEEECRLAYSDLQGTFESLHEEQSWSTEALENACPDSIA